MVTRVPPSTCLHLYPAEGSLLVDVFIEFRASSRSRAFRDDNAAYEVPSFFLCIEDVFVCVLFSFFGTALMRSGWMKARLELVLTHLVYSALKGRSITCHVGCVCVCVFVCSRCSSEELACAS